MDLLSDRVGNINGKARLEISPSMVLVLDYSGLILQTSPSPGKLISCLRTIRAITLSASPNEESSLTKLTPLLLDFQQMGEVLGEALLTLNTLV